MGNAPTRRPLGLQKITKVCYRIFTLFPGIQDRGSEPSRSDDSIFESYADTREGKKRKKPLRQKGVKIYKDLMKEGRKSKSVAPNTDKG